MSENSLNKDTINDQSKVYVLFYTFFLVPLMVTVFGVLFFIVVRFVTYESGDQTLDFNVNDPTITLTGDITGAGTMTNLGSFSIATTRTAGSTSTADIANGAVTTIKLGDSQVTTGKIADNAITQAKMADDSVGSAEMKTLSTLLIINSAGATVKTLHGAGA